MWPALLASLFSLIDKVIPDPQAAQAAKLHAMDLQNSKEGAAMAAELAVTLAQIDVNKADAAGASPMQRNGRPFIVWVCGVALAWDTVIRPIVTYGAAWAGHPLPMLPNLQTEQLYTILGGVLGLGVMRSAEKIKGVA
jgi:Holin of 3TMs, for gene-transfer release